MSEPIFDAFTETYYYRRLSEIYRQADAQNDWVLKRWLSGILAQHQITDTLIDRFKFVTRDSGGAANDTSDLTDPLTADASWLPWLAQQVGILPLDTTLSVTDQRNLIRDAVIGNRPGSKAAIQAAAAKNLTGTRAVGVFDHSTNIGTVGTAGQWDVLIVTVASETPGGVDVVADVINAGQKPAGIKLYTRTYEASWATIEAALLDWTSWEAQGSWRSIEETGL